MDNKHLKLEGAQTRQGPPRPRQPHFAVPAPFAPRPQAPVNMYAPNYYGARPMELSSAQQPEANAATPAQPLRGPLTPQEHDHHHQNRLCMRCGQAGHFARDHPDYRPRFQPSTQQPATPKTYAAAASPETSKDQA